MKKQYIKLTYLGVFLSLSLLLTGCNKPGDGATPTLNVTQAYQTVEALLTDSVAQTPSATPITPTINPPTMSPAANETLEVTQPTVTPNMTATPGSVQVCNQAAAAYPKIDITIDDDTEMTPGNTFTKIWRVVNIGTCTWGESYAAVWFSGENFSASDRVELEQVVAPNESIDISVDMTAPDKPGEYQSNWKLSTGDGTLFGIGPGGGSPFWVRIIVVEVTPPNPSTTPTATATPVVAVSGPAILAAGETIDLDSILLNVPSADLAFSVTAGESPTYELVPQGIASLGIFGAGQPSISNCQNATLSSAAISVVDLAGTYLCFQTDIGLPGWVLIDNLNTDETSLSLQILTWSLP